MAEKHRCPWATSSTLLQRYHDEEWGVPVHDDVTLFELITLEGAQAGLSWETVLRKRDGYRRAFAGFDRDRVARFTTARIAKIVADPGVIRHRGKIESVVSNATALRSIAAECGSFDAYLWDFTGGKMLSGERASFDDEPPLMPLANDISKDLRKRGLRFVGPTITYAFMQAVGLVNDHLASCFRRTEVAAQ